MQYWDVERRREESKINVEQGLPPVPPPPIQKGEEASGAVDVAGGV